MASVASGLAIITIFASSLPWVVYSPGGDSATSTVSGLQGGSWGLSAVAIGVGMAVAAMLVAVMVWRLRFVIVVATAASGLAIAIASWHRPVTLDTGAVVTGPPGTGLVVTAAAYGATVLVAVILLLLDCCAPEAGNAAGSALSVPRADVRLAADDQPPRGRRALRESIAHPWSP